MIGKRIQILRKERDLLQKDLASKINLSQQTISLYEASKREPDYETLNTIAKFFDVSTDYLLGNSDIRNPYNEDKDKYKDVDDVEEAMKIILEQPGLMLKGSILSDESKIILANAIQMGLRTAEELEKKKNEGDSNE